MVVFILSLGWNSDVCVYDENLISLGGQLQIILCYFTLIGNINQIHICPVQQLQTNKNYSNIRFIRFIIFYDAVSCGVKGNCFCDTAIVSTTWEITHPSKCYYSITVVPFHKCTTDARQNLDEQVGENWPVLSMNRRQKTVRRAASLPPDGK